MYKVVRKHADPSEVFLTITPAAMPAGTELVIGIGTRYSDFTTASRTAFQNSGVRFVNINVAGLDAIKHAGLAVQADARETLEALLPLLDGYRVDDGYVAKYGEVWRFTVGDGVFDDQGGPAAAYRIEASKVIAFAKEPHGQTTYPPVRRAQAR